MANDLESGVSDEEIQEFRKACYEYFEGLSPKEFAEQFLEGSDDARMIYLEYLNLEENKGFKEKVTQYFDGPRELPF